MGARIEFPNWDMIVEDVSGPSPTVLLSATGGQCIEWPKGYTMGSGSVANMVYVFEYEDIRSSIGTLAKPTGAVVTPRVPSRN